MVELTQYTNDAYWWRAVADSGSMLFKMHDQHHGNKRWQLKDLMQLEGWKVAKHIFLFDCESWDDLSKFNDPRVHVFQPGRIDHPRYHFYPFWLEYVQKVEQVLQLHTRLEDVSNKPYQFDALLGVPRSCRVWVKNKIDNHPRANEFLINMYDQVSNNGPNVANPDTWVQGHDLDQRYNYWIDVPGVDHQYDVCSLLPYRIYNNCWFSLISETHDHSYAPIITEKTAKCLLGRRLFVHFGNPGLLQHLRNNGFQTFGDIIDESYDLEPDKIKRLEKAWQQIEWLLTQDPGQLIQNCKKIFDHNQEIMLKYDFNKHIINELRQLAQAK
jgi:hypothetical protein